MSHTRICSHLENAKYAAVNPDQLRLLERACNDPSEIADPDPAESKPARSVSVSPALPFTPPSFRPNPVWRPSNKPKNAESFFPQSAILKCPKDPSKIKEVLVVAESIWETNSSLEKQGLLNSSYYDAIFLVKDHGNEDLSGESHGGYFENFCRYLSELGCKPKRLTLDAHGSFNQDGHHFIQLAYNLKSPVLDASVDCFEHFPLENLKFLRIDSCWTNWKTIQRLASFVSSRNDSKILEVLFGRDGINYGNPDDLLQERVMIVPIRKLSTYSFAMRKPTGAPTNVVYADGKIVPNLPTQLKGEEDLLYSGHPYYKLLEDLQKIGWPKEDACIFANQILIKHRNNAANVFEALLLAVEAEKDDKPSLSSFAALKWVSFLKAYQNLRQHPKDQKAAQNLLQQSELLELKVFTFVPMQALVYLDPIKNRHLIFKLSDLASSFCLFPQLTPILETYLKHQPNDRDILWKLARNYFDLGAYQKAEPVYQKMLKVGFRDFEIDSSYLKCLVNQRAYDRAEAAVNAALRRFPNHPWFLFQKAEIKYKKMKTQHLSLEEQSRQNTILSLEFRKAAKHGANFRKNGEWSDDHQVNCLMREYEFSPKPASSELLERLIGFYEKRGRLPYDPTLGFGPPNWWLDLEKRILVKDPAAEQYKSRLLSLYQKAKQLALGLYRLGAQKLA